MTGRHHGPALGDEQSAVGARRRVRLSYPATLAQSHLSDPQRCVYSLVAHAVSAEDPSARRRNPQEYGRLVGRFARASRLIESR